MDLTARTHPERLAQATLYLPTRRAGRLAREVFLDVLKTDAVILPRIVALGDIDEDELAFAEDGEPAASPRSTFRRRLVVGTPAGARATGRRMGQGDPVRTPLVVGGPASTLALADDLARLIDDMVTRGVEWSRLTASCPISSTNIGN